MKRVRWHEASWKASLRSVANSLRRYAFNSEADDGFLVHRVREDFVEATHIEKVVLQETEIDPFDNKKTFIRTSYRRCNFRLSPTFPQLEIQDAPRSSSFFLSRLSEAMSFELAISPLTVDLPSWLSKLEEIAAEPLLVDALHVGNFEVERGVSAGVLLRGDHDVRTAMAKLTKHKPHVIDRMQLRLPLPTGEVSSVVIHRSSSVTFGAMATEEAVAMLRNSFAKSFE
jgi:hypothetical protein